MYPLVLFWHSHVTVCTCIYSYVTGMSLIVVVWFYRPADVFGAFVSKLILSVA